MISLLLAIIYVSFVSLGLPDSLLGSAWPVIYPELDVPVSWSGIIFMIISVGTVISSLQSDRLTKRLGAGKVTAISVALTRFFDTSSLNYQPPNHSSSLIYQQIPPQKKSKFF